MMEHKNTVSEDIKVRLLDEARLIFARYGYNKTTVDDIAKAVGKGKSTFYYYFKSKEEIFKSVIDKEAILFRTKLIESISIKASPIEKIKNYILTRLESFKELVNFYQISFIDEIRDKYEQEQVNIIKMVLLESIQNKLVEIDDVEIVAEAMTDILKGLEYHLMFKPLGSTKTKEKIDKVLDLIFKGITK